MKIKISDEHWALACGMWNKLCKMKDAPEPERYEATVAAMRELAAAMCGQYQPDALESVTSAFDEVLRGGDCGGANAHMYWESLDEGDGYDEYDWDEEDEEDGEEEDEEEEREVLDYDIAGEWSSADYLEISIHDFSRDESLDEKYNRLAEEAAYHIVASLWNYGGMEVFRKEAKIYHNGTSHYIRIDK